MAKRFALVVWWLGALVVASTAVGAVVALFDARPMNSLGNVALLLIPAAVCWAIAFVLGGSFWRPPIAD